MSLALETIDLEKRFGGLTAANRISLRLERGARHALIGPNGAGKTTLVNVITGALRPDAGHIALAGRDVTTVPLHRRVHLGLVRSFQVTSLFPTRSVFEHIALAVAERDRVGRAIGPWHGFSSAVADEADAIAHQVGLHADGTRPVRVLAYGRQRLVELAMVLALRPRVLLLDEPAAGLGADDHHALLDVVASLPPAAAVLLIEHDMGLVFRFASAITVLAGGAVLASGTPDEIRGNVEVRAAYLGSRHD
jgi:ABC-type branched-subunit amino acid transport system ATPase component